MAEQQLPIFNPATIGFIASSHGVDGPDELAPILGIQSDRLWKLELGVASPTWEELDKLCETTGLTPESMPLKHREPQALAA